MAVDLVNNVSVQPVVCKRQNKLAVDRSSIGVSSDGDISGVGDANA